MERPPPDRSRDRRIEDVTNLAVIHPASRALLPLALRFKISANAVSVAGLVAGSVAALCYYQWSDVRLASLGFVLSIVWLIADGLDGMVARATGTTSALGRMLDGLCDHGVFILIYVALAISVGTTSGWVLAVAAGIAHAVQSNLYEAERARFHRRLRGDFSIKKLASRFAVVRFYDGVAGRIDRSADPFDRAMADAQARDALQEDIGARYAAAAVRPMRLMCYLSANIRVIVIYIACVCDDPKYFWSFEIVLLTIIAYVAIARHRRVEAMLMEQAAAAGQPRLGLSDCIR